MSAERVVHLEQALVAILAEAEQKGLDADELRRQATGGLIGNISWRWVTAEYVPGAIDEIESAVRMLRRL
ncbi:hypothetical protein [Pseudomonas donghuensis]|uniref:hypothetical protein n=1 Tax=Pseudomonas donghuensis TaxID=1163398 RepID=UPI0020C3DF9C|nr:hypothetical protein [Pseudomonas donghuensis]MCP6695914.1 hypothetical protein [Pseudomonas donghuensis]